MEISQPVNPPATSLTKFVGILLINLAVICYTISNFTYVYLVNGRNHSQYELLWFRGFFNFVCSYFSIVINKSPLIDTGKEEMRFINYRSFYLIGISFIFMYALKGLPVSMVVVLYYVSPIFTIFLSHFILDDKMQKADIACSLVGLAGIVVITKPPFLFGEQYSFTTIQYIYCGLVLISAYFNSMFLITTKQTKVKVGTDIMTYYLGFWMSISISICLVLFPSGSSNSYTFSDWMILLACVGAFSIAIIFLHFALKMESPSMVGILTYSQIIYTYLTEIIIYKQSVDTFSIIGSVLIIGSSITVLIRRANAGKSPEKIYRKLNV